MRIVGRSIDMSEKIWEYLLSEEIKDILENEASGVISVYSGSMESYEYPLNEWSDKCRAIAESMNTEIGFDFDKDGEPIIKVRKKKE
jgi:hypothetical protein